MLNVDILIFAERACTLLRLTYILFIIKFMPQMVSTMYDEEHE